MFFFWTLKNINATWYTAFHFLYTLLHPTTSCYLAYLSPLLRAMLMSFSMPPASLRALVFSMFLVMTSCSAQQMAVIVSSDIVFPTKVLLLVLSPQPPLVVVLLLLLPPGKRWTRSLMAYLPEFDGGVTKMERWCKNENSVVRKKKSVSICDAVFRH